MEEKNYDLMNIVPFSASSEPLQITQSNTDAKDAEISFLYDEETTSTLQEIEELLKPSDIVTLLNLSQDPMPSLSTSAATVIDAAKETRTVPSKSVAKRKNAHRERVKHELAYLRQKSVELETRLNMLRAGELTIQSKSDFTREKSLWKAIAERQLFSRRLAETENKHLKRVAYMQRELVMQLEQSLRNQLMEPLTMSTGRNISQSNYFTREDALLFDQFIGELDLLYTQIDTVFEELGLNEAMDKVRWHSPSNAVKLQPLEFVDVDVIPFNLQSVAKAMWQSSLYFYQKRGQLFYRHVPEPQDTAAIKFRMECNCDVSIICKMAGRRYVKQSQTVIVWRALCEGEGELAGILADETGWVEYCDDSSSPGQRTIAKAYVRIIPKSTSAMKASANPQSVEKFTNLYIAASDKDTLAMNCLMENLLLEETMGIRSTSRANRNF